MGFVIWNTVARAYYTGGFVSIREGDVPKFADGKSEARHFPTRGAAVNWLTENFPFGAPKNFEIEASDFVIY